MEVCPAGASNKDSQVTPEPSRLDVMMAALVQVEPHLLVFLF